MKHITNSQRAEILVQALPYIRQYYNKILVIKYGGNAMINEDLKNAVMGDIALLNLVGIKVVLVHGGGPEITDLLGKIGKKSEFLDGLRVTDKETVEAVRRNDRMLEEIGRAVTKDNTDYSLITKEDCEAVLVNWEKYLTGGLEADDSDPDVQEIKNNVEKNALSKQKTMKRFKNRKPGNKS